MFKFSWTDGLESFTEGVTAVKSTKSLRDINRLFKYLEFGDSEHSIAVSPLTPCLVHIKEFLALTQTFELGK